MVYSEHNNYGAMLVTDEGERMGLNDINAMSVQMLDDNTLENAITACKEIADDANKFLYLKIDRETDTYTFLIKNSIDHSVMDSNPRLTTTKADKKQHGLGTSIIREIARKYNGRCDFYESEGMFCCQVTLMADTTVLN
jgi:sensor histidine kinase regulating citrate/malate metabolism